jgi:hypothetical protein
MLKLKLCRSHVCSIFEIDFRAVLGVKRISEPEGTRARFNTEGRGD